MTKKMLMQIVKEIDTPEHLECLGCGQTYPPPSIYDNAPESCPSCNSEEFVRIIEAVA